MTRFKEQRRIDAAIDHANELELKWALAYAESRLDSATMKHHRKHWRGVVTRVQKALEALHKESISMLIP